MEAAFLHRPGSGILRSLARLAALLACLFSTVGVCLAAPGAEGFADRGYYLTFMRMPVMGLPEWKQAMDCFAEDDANLVILWMGGGFRSVKYPITWQYNAEHQNVQQDFVRELIDYAHAKEIRVLLGFTPFGYDGVNQFPIERPELKARRPDGQPVNAFGIHCWGWNLCPAQTAAQQFMREYVREMFFDFYPNADGLFIESSDYAICHCPQCAAGAFYQHEFQFVREISDEVWAAKPGAKIIVYPHYFTGKKVPGLDATAAKLPFDPRWTLFFTPHSAHFDADLLRQAKSAIFWSDRPVLGSPARIQAHTKAARENGMTGFVPSMEAFSYVPYRSEGGEPFIVGKRRRPFGLDPLGAGKMPYRSLVARMQRFAVREFTSDPDLPFETFKSRLGEHLFGSAASKEAIEDALAFQAIWVHQSDWYWQSPLLEPDFLAARAQRLNWPPDTLGTFRAHLERVRQIATRYASASNPGEKELGTLAQEIVDRWAAAPSGVLGAEKIPSESSDVFVSGQDGYHSYRIPGVETAPDGSIVAFAEARKHNLDDPGYGKQDIDLAYKRSTDNGATWSPMVILEDPGEGWSAANPATLVDRTTGRLWVFYLRSRPGRSTESSRPGTDDMQTLARWSADNGQTWSEPIDLTAVGRDMNDPEWRASVPGPGGAIQTRSGRLLVPMWKAPFANFVLYSDDRGKTWHRSGLVPAEQGGNENQLVALADGRILMDIRQEGSTHRWWSESSDDGLTWFERRPGIKVTPVMCAVERLCPPGEPECDQIVWSGPAGQERRRLVLRISEDGGKTFPVEKLISEEYAAYSDLTVLRDGKIGILWERGVDRGYQFITFTRVRLD
ncbi:MAG: exo-alpha-sialidase [Verrucomicrobiia bacterium]